VNCGGLAKMGMHCRRLLLILILALVIPACGNSGSPPINHNGSALAVNIEVPPGVSTQGWTVNDGLLGQGDVQGASSKVPQTQATDLRLVTSVDGAGQIRLMALCNAGQQTVTLTPSTTAIACTALSLFLMKDYEDNPAAFVATILNLPAVIALVDIISSKLQQNTGSISEDPEIKQAIHVAWEAALAALHPSAPSASKAVVTPSGFRSGVNVEKESADPKNNKLWITVTNEYARRLDVHIEYESMPGVSLSSNTLKAFPPVNSISFEIPADYHPDEILVKAYGLGIHSTADWANEPRQYLAIRPSVATVIDQFLVPIVSAIAGVKGLLRLGQPGSVAALLKDIVSDSLNDAVADQILSGNVIYALSSIVEIGLSTLLANNADLLIQAFLEIGISAPAAVIRKIASYFIPFVGQVYGAYQLGTALAPLITGLYSVLNSNLMETFAVSNAPPAVTITASPTQGASPLTVSFSVNSAVPIVEYRWSFENPGVYDVTSATTGNAVHQYVHPGPSIRVFTATLTAKDEDGAVAKKEIKISVGQDDPPIVISRTQSTGGPVPRNSTVDVRVVAVDPEGLSLTYIWQPEYGTVSGSGPEVTWTVPAICPPSILMYLTVKDPVGNESKTHYHLYVENGGPGGFTWDASPALGSFIAGQAITFTAVGASDPDGDPYTLTTSIWAGGFSTLITTVTGDTVTFVPSEPGTYNLDYLIVDPWGYGHGSGFAFTVSPRP
jgi:PKD repeat protein